MIFFLFFRPVSDLVLMCSSFSSSGFSQNQRALSIKGDFFFFFSDLFLIWFSCALHSPAQVGGSVIYISTDYVFDGKNAPYKETAVPTPLNAYGKSKLEGEKVALAEGKGQ